MPMALFASRFSRLGAAETRTMIVPEGVGVGVPAGRYDLVEFYCDEAGCDCRRTIITVVQEETMFERILATISYGWEDEQFYRNRGHGAGVKGPYLDPLNKQGPFAGELLAMFEDIVLTPEYEARLKRHYEMFRSTVDDSADDPEQRRLSNRRKSHRDPRRRPKGADQFPGRR